MSDTPPKVRRWERTPRIDMVARIILEKHGPEIWERWLMLHYDDQEEWLREHHYDLVSDTPDCWYIHWTLQDILNSEAPKKMGEFTPSTEQVRAEYVRNSGDYAKIMGEYFDRWLVNIKSEAWDQAIESVDRYRE